ncbi:MAG: hypothetical protein J5959_02360 [Butyrivibrio sp.]|nr:hypothetical protein [Butyrivibrio sp.]
MEMRDYKKDELEILDFSIDKAELKAKGTLRRGKASGRFSYSIFEGKINVISEVGEIGTDAEDKAYVKKIVLDELFPLAGEEYIAGLLEMENKAVPMSNGFIQAVVDFKPSEMLAGLCDVTMKEQVFVGDGRYVLVKPAKDMYKVMEEGKAPFYLRNYYEVTRLLGSNFRRVLDDEVIDRAKRRICRPVRYGRMFEEKVQGLTI